jgi:hypothetical protein
VRFITSLKSKDKFTDLANQFENHKANLHLDLQMHATVTAAKIKSSMEDVSAMMTVVFEQCRSPQEREVAAFIRSKGSVDKVIADDKLLSDILTKGNSKEERKIRSMHSERKVRESKQDAGAPPNVTKVREEIAQDPWDISSEDADTFERLWAAVLNNLDELKQTVTGEADRVIAAVLAGPHERIVDQVSMYPPLDITQNDGCPVSKVESVEGLGQRCSEDPQRRGTNALMYSCWDSQPIY